jgi:PTH1 family peptidyl-tRNA hydrolase
MKRVQTQHAPTKRIRLVAFLGNPGSQYEKTRHNVAWIVCDVLSDNSGAWKSKFHGTFLKRSDVVLLKPDTYVNRSGRSVQSALAFFSYAPEELLIVHDDLETPFGTVSLAWNGGHRGQNGVRSIETALGDPAFWRLRIGIGRPPSGRRVAEWVLQRFSPDEEAHLPRIIDIGAEVLSTARTSPVETTRSA